MDLNPINKLDDLLDRVNAGLNNPDQDEVGQPGSEQNPWIGIDRVVRGQKQFYAFSGAERRRIRRQHERDAKNEQERGQRAWNRQQRKGEFDAGTVRQQLRILQGELQVSPDMKRNLENHILRQTRLNGRDPEARRELRLHQRNGALDLRRARRVEAGKARHADLVALGHRAR